MSKKKKTKVDRNLQLTENFQLWEFVEGSLKNLEPELIEMAWADLEERYDELIPNAYRIAQEAQIIRNYFNRSMVITCGHRPEKWNYQMGRMYYSWHQDFKAFDFVIPGVSLNYIYNFIEQTFKRGGRYKYPTFIHKDINPKYDS